MLLKLEIKYIQKEVNYNEYLLTFAHFTSEKKCDLFIDLVLLFDTTGSSFLIKISSAISDVKTGK